MQKALIATMTAAVLAMGVASAQAKPNFSGDWKLNIEKSNFGQMPAPTSSTEKITHNDPELKVVTAQTGGFGDYTSEFSFTTDGKDCPNQLNDFKITSKVTWDGDTLLFDSKMDFQGNAMTGSEKWTLSPDGKTLTIARHISGPMGEGDTTSILEKQ